MKRQFFLRVGLFTGLLLFAAACHKPTTSVAPEPDTDFQGSVDVSFAALVISDIEMMCSFPSEADFSPKFYMDSPNSSNPTLSSSGPNNEYIFVSFNNTLCKDGRVRNGSVYMNYVNTDPNSKYCYRYEFQGKVSLLNYKVDGWDVELNNTFLITNRLTSPLFNPAQTDLSWSLSGDFVLKYRADSTRNMHCTVNLVKTLANTSDKNVVNMSKLTAITWSLATVKYTGTIFGETSRNVPFKYTINDANPLVRDFTCFPDKVAGIDNSNNVSSQNEEFHPFKDGRVSFVTGDLYPRDISYGNEQSTYHDVKNSPLELTPQCDNKGIITIKGISYPVNFAKDYK